MIHDVEPEVTTTDSTEDFATVETVEGTAREIPTVEVASSLDGLPEDYAAKLSDISDKLRVMFEAENAEGYIVIARGLLGLPGVTVFGPTNPNEQELINLLALGQYNVISDLNRRRTAMENSAKNQEAQTEAATDATTEVPAEEVSEAQA